MTLDIMQHNICFEPFLNKAISFELNLHNKVKPLMAVGKLSKVFEWIDHERSPDNGYRYLVQLIKWQN